MNNSADTTIGDLVSDGSIVAIQDGNHGELHPKSKEYVPEGIPFVMASDVRDGRLMLEDCKRLPKSRTDRLRIGFAKSGDVLLTHKGTVGQVAIVPPIDDYAMLTPQVTYYRTDPGKLDPKYLAFCFRSEMFQAQLGGISAQSTRPYVGITTQRHLTIRMRSIDEQRRIVSILGPYDELIETNRRRIAVLEAMARGVFEEWFVHFRYPGHGNCKIVDTPEGPLPQGWAFGPASKLLAFDPKTRVPKEGDKPFIPMGALDTSTSLVSNLERRSGNSGAKYKNDDTLFARITPCLENGKTGIVRDLRSDGGIGFGSTEFIVMRADRAGAAYAYCLARFDGFRRNAQAGMSGASGRQRAATDNVSAFQVGIPPAGDDVFRVFEETAWPMLELVGQLGRTNELLAAARDLLLPRLTSCDASIVASAPLEEVD